MIINWINNNIFPLIQNEGWLTNIFMRLDRLEKDSHPPLFEKEQLNKLHKRVEDLETVAFVKRFGSKMKDYEGTD